MWVCAKAHTAIHKVIVQYAQLSEVCAGGVIIMGEAKRVIGI